MFIFTTKHYIALGKHLLQHINSDSMINITIEQEQDDYTLIFIAAMFPHHREIEYPEGVIYALVDIIPIWWSMRTFNSTGESLNDFDFNLLKEQICHN